MVEGSVFKRHPISSACYALYIIGWLYIAYMAYRTDGDSEVMGFILLGFGTAVGAPFLIVTTILTATSKTASKFYFRLALLILAPIPLFVLVSMLMYTSPTLGAD